MIDQAERTVQNRLREIKSNRSEFSGVVFDQVSQEVSNSFATVRQFFLDTPTRAQATSWRAWGDVQNDVNDDMEDVAGMADFLWTPSFPNIFSPQQSDIQATNEASPEEHRASNGGGADNVEHEISHQVAAAVEQDAEAVARCDTVSSCRHASSSPFEGPSQTEAPSPSEVSSPSDSSSANDVPSPADTPSYEENQSTASTPASTPPSACRESFKPADSHTYPNEMDASSDDQSEMDCDEGDTAPTPQYIPDRETAPPCASPMQVDMPPTSESAGRKRKASTGKIQRNDKATKISGPKAFNPLQLQNVPGHMKQPVQFWNEIHTGKDVDSSSATKIQRLFYGIGHPKWFYHLRETCRILREERDQRFPTSDGSLSQCYGADIHLNENGLVGRILRRYNSMELVCHRNGQRKSRRVSSNVLKDMLRKASPELRTAVESSPEFVKGLGHLRSGLNRGRHWYALSEKFGTGILAVVPIHSSFGLPSIAKIEDMPDKAFDVLIDALERHRGDFLHRLSRALSGMRDLLLGGDLTPRYKFESAEGIESYEPGSDSIIDSCAIDTVI